MKDLVQGIKRTGTDASTWNTIRNNYVICTRNGKSKPFWLRKEICIASQSNPNKDCNRRCEERKKEVEK